MIVAMDEPLTLVVGAEHWVEGIFRRNLHYSVILNDGFALLLHFGCGFEYLTTFRDIAPSGVHPLLLRRELGLLSGIRLHSGIAFRHLGLGFGSMNSLRIISFAFLSPAATTIVGNVVRITVGTPFLFLCHRALPIQNVWTSTG